MESPQKMEENEYQHCPQCGQKSEKSVSFMRRDFGMRRFEIQIFFCKICLVEFVSKKFLIQCVKKYGKPMFMTEKEMFEKVEAQVKKYFSQCYPHKGIYVEE